MRPSPRKPSEVQRPFALGLSLPLSRYSGGLISYGPDVLDQYRRVAGYVYRILKGEKPAETAKTLGQEVPRSLLARAEEVIE